MHKTKKSKRPEFRCAPRAFPERARRGVSTLEMLIAFSVLIISTSAAVLVSFGSQELSVSTQTETEALYKADAAMLGARAAAAGDFFSLQSTSTASSSADIYAEALSVADITPCLKLVTSTASWDDGRRTKQVSLAALIGSPAIAAAEGGDCDVTPPGSWTNPQTLASADFGGSPPPASAIDVHRGIAFLTALPSLPGDDDFFAYDISRASTSAPPAYLAGARFGSGANAIDAAGDYAYLANNASSSQLEVVDISDPAHPVLVASSTLPGVIGSAPQGRSIFYYNSRVYIGTHRTAGHEFHIYNVANPLHPVHLGDIELNHNINDIQVRDEYVGGIKKTVAFLATSGNSSDVIVLDVTNPASITRTDIDLPGNHDAEALYLLGNTLYAGRLWGAGANFYAINVSNPFGSSPPVVGEATINADIRAVRIVGNLAFLATSDANKGFQVFDVSDPARMHSVGTLTYPESVMALDYAGGKIYMANQNGAALRIVYSP